MGVGERGSHLRKSRWQAVLLRHSQKTDVETFRFVPEAWQHWLYKPSRQETAVSVVHSVFGDRGAIVKVIKTAFRPACRNSI